MNRLLCRACLSRGLAAGAGRRGAAGSAESPLRRLLDEASAFGETDPSERELQWATEPYAARPAEGGAPARPTVQPQDASVLLFPGQGAQFVGMGKKLRDTPAARDLYDLASSVLGWDVWRVCAEGPAEELARRCQAAVLVTSLAALERAREERPATLERARAAAGFSLGEITALVWAGALPFEQALRLVEVRAAAMSAAAAERAGGMLTVWLHADANLPHAMLRAREHAAERGVPAPVCQVANYLYPNCKVIAGDEEALKFVESRGREFGVRRAARVSVPGAFHSPLMARATAPVREALRLCSVGAPRAAVWSCAAARAYRDARDVARGVARLAAAPVRWEQTLHALFARPRDTPLPFTVTLGPGNALRATLKQVNARAWDASVHIDV